MTNEVNPAGKDEVTAALVRVQQAIKTVAKGKENPFYHSSYADLPSIMGEIKKPLADNGIAVSQAMEFREGAGWVMVTKLLHTSGQYLEGLFPIAPVPQEYKDGRPAAVTPQGWGSAQTYARRYGLVALVGVTVDDEDDDGNAASAKNGTGKAAETAAKMETAKAAAPVGEKATEAPTPGRFAIKDPDAPMTGPQYNAVVALCERAKTTPDKMLEEMGIANDHDVTKGEASRMIEFLNKKLAAR